MLSSPSINETFDIFRLTYCSTTSDALSLPWLQGLAVYSTTYNQTMKITGRLLLVNKAIIQLIDGEEGEIRSLYKRIERDPRHLNPMVLNAAPTPMRGFSDWKMGIKDLNPRHSGTCLFDLTPTTFDDTLLSLRGVSREIFESYGTATGLKTR